MLYSFPLCKNTWSYWFLDSELMQDYQYIFVDLIVNVISLILSTVPVFSRSYIRMRRAGRQGGTGWVVTASMQCVSLYQYQRRLSDSFVTGKDTKNIIDALCHI